MKARITVTDTFGGEVNYSWMKSFSITFPETVTDLAMVRQVKKRIQWNGLPCSVLNFGDFIEIRPRKNGYNVVCFVDFQSMKEQV
jgi:hypothetical protein